MEIDKPNLPNVSLQRRLDVADWIFKRISILQMLVEINTQVASFRDMLIHIGHDKHDSPELRVQIRKTRRACVTKVNEVAKMILPQLKR